ncbi:tRNA pseudouridine(55) synthase TruB [Pediococcus claussenii]|uniref:tRNA pseudouridine synthase B n=1 Tax=Pediococcus claussenii (strain ATCC BAA-344 / DSM 14800 / JCM 18046 / KCTC 3811 / LMG 21948 / P06) TaxID=701521 RepID=G8PDB1_PEDCP|nr:tRNA pseudouridine(55) synthase TruB [Pediococcus claussenii]AEV95246.1 tRNA pseudouridine synthase B [Pediococcus claussenii ATCC BAA-344]ANZ70475.1 tRNA pseudouridine(55) synthase [Pediococcus claussenii]ANZ72290.1 tRNA pseudouridine(55) synthase [Pediococcus claussenii]KRN19572.1 truB protein [Pediococcus claussenii]
MDGIIPINKERKMTSHDVVAKIRRILHTKRVGHSGTLDPNVDGVLIVCVGKATKVSDYLMNSGKIYRGKITLGFSTITEDLDGEVIASKVLKIPFTDEELAKTFNSLTGEIIQIPPMYSAVKVNGRKLYEYARSGEEVERPQRMVSITEFHQIGKSEFDEKRGTQTIKFEVKCSKGTYVRTLAVDFGKKLGVPAVMSDLTRMSSGGFDLSHTITLNDLSEKVKNQDYSFLHPIETVFKNLITYNLSSDELEKVQNGAWLRLNMNDDQLLLKYNDRLQAVYKRDSETNLYRPEKMFLLED